jgi:hypothetical protein
MFHLLIDHIFHIAMNIFDIIISMINNLLYFIIIMLIYGIKMTLKLHIYLTIQKPNYRHFSIRGFVFMLCVVLKPNFYD